MKLAMIGLGKMGMNMARRLMQGNHDIIAFDLSEAAVEEIAAEGASGASSLQQVVEQLSVPRIVWMMLPAGRPVEETIGRLKELLSPEDIIIDGGNSYYKDDHRRYEELQAAGIEVLYDDRDTKAGFAFNDADLIGIPYRLILSPKNMQNGQIEFKTRDGLQKSLLSIENAVDFVVDTVNVSLRESLEEST